MRNIAVLVLLLLVFAVRAEAQFIPGTGADKIQVVPNSAPGKIIYKTSLLAPFQEFHNINLSVEIPLGRFWSVEPGIGYIFNYQTGDYKLNSKDLNFGPELSLRYFIPEKFMNGLYTGLKATYTTYNYLKGTWLVPDPAFPDSIQLDFSNPYEFTENHYNLYLIAGIQPVFLKHFVLDFGGGFGVQMRQVINRYDPMPPNTPEVPKEFISYKPVGLITFKAGYFF